MATEKQLDDHNHALDSPQIQHARRRQPAAQLDAPSSGVTIVSNRLPIVLEFDQRAGQWSGKPGAGGLVSAMNPILAERGGTWVGWPGMSAQQARGYQEQLGELLADVGAQAGYTLEPVMLSAEEIDDYYGGFANSVLWPLFHGFPNRCDFNPRFWESYLAVNRKFAQGIAQTVLESQPVWVHDYHLIGVAQMLRSMAQVGHIGYFLHIPFPALENFVKLPWRAELMQALLSYDLLGFQSRRDERNFMECVQRLVPEAKISRANSGATVSTGSNQVSVGVFPISIDFEQFEQRARSEAVTRRMAEMRREIGPSKMLLGIDRLDYTKGLIERCHAFEMLLKKHPELIEEVVLFQLVIPSRENVPEYQALKREIDRIVGRINGQFSTAAWQPIHYLYNTVSITELSALYRFATAAVVTPLCDGMNLVAKEYCAAQVESKGVLILSEFAGAADEFHQDALLVNPYDTVGCAAQLYRAVTMGEDERVARMDRLRQRIKSHDVFDWANHFVDSLHEPTTLTEVSEIEYLPTIELAHPGHPSFLGARHFELGSRPSL